VTASPPQPRARLAQLRRAFGALGSIAPVTLAFGFGLASLHACGGTTGASAQVALSTAALDPGSGAVDCNAASPYDFFVVEDFESGAATGWYTNNEVCYACQNATNQCLDSGTTDVWIDPTDPYPADCGAPLDQCMQQCLAIQPSPSYGTDPLQSTLIPEGGRCGSHYALQVLGGPFIAADGAVGVRFCAGTIDGGTCGIDATSYDGIAVWMRTAPGFANDPHILVTDRYTDTANNKLIALADQADEMAVQPFCNYSPPPATPSGLSGYQAGCDKFGTYANVNQNWQLFLLPFEEMRQGGWGRQQNQLDLSGIMSIEIDYGQGSWDLWIDDVAFYRRKSP
jgi:hypothetical protein